MRSTFIARLAVLSALMCAALLCGSWSLAHAAPKSTVAVLYFDYGGKTEDMEFLRKGLTQMLVADLADTPGVTIVERTRLEEILAELDLGSSKKIDRNTAVRVGKLLSARYLVLGGYFDFKDTLQVSIKVVDVETGTVIAGISQRRKTDDFWTLEQQLAAEIRDVLRDKVVGANESPAPIERRRKHAKRRAKSRTAVAKTTAPTATDNGNGASPAPPRSPSRSVHAVGSGAPKPAAAAKATLDAPTAARYGRALDAMDRGDKAAARSDLEAVVQKSPDFTLASVDLASLAM